MEPRSTLFPGRKKQPLNTKSTKSIPEASKSTAKEPPISRKKHVFGTNIPIRRKPTNTIAQKHPKVSINEPRSTKNSNCFQNQESVISVRTPPVQKNNNNNIISTPYYTPENSRFDMLETASYWLSQIKLAESVGKHYVSAAFFGLAYESNAQPISKLRNELKQYLARHSLEGLSLHTEWISAEAKYSAGTSNNMASEQLHQVQNILQRPSLDHP